MSLIENAKTTLDAAYANATYYPNATCSHQDFIDYVVDNTHLTYKYILFTALLAKATDESINPLCLQKKSTLPGAYDARTICHKVIVPFEMETLDKALGGSNEPFLNKPARFPELSKNNAVRRGNDKAILDSLCDNLPLIKTSSDAFQCLVYLLCKLIKIRDAQRKTLVFTVNDNANLPSKLMSFIEAALIQSHEGETLTLMIAGIYHLLYLDYADAVVEVHPVNESGASSKEISDLDIYINQELISSNELKDKDFAETDVRHAADKVINAGGNHMLFIMGPQAHPIGDFIPTIEKEYQERNFFLSVISYRSFFSVVISLLRNLNTEEFLRFILDKAHNTKFKEDTIVYIDMLAQTYLGLKRQS